MSKIAVAGKGGSGKTTVAGVLARHWASDGLGVEATYALVGAREALLPEGPAIASPMEDVVDRFASEAGEHLRSVQVKKSVPPWLRRPLGRAIARRVGGQARPGRARRPWRRGDDRGQR